ncbi:MAG: trimethylamine methyltransferase family protein [Candidatus Acetothermia bacterium]
MTKDYEPIAGLKFELLDDEALERVEDGAYRILESVGMKLTEEESKVILTAAGATIEGDRVFLPPELVKDAIDSAPTEMVLYDQNGYGALVLTGYNSFFGASVDGPALLDPEEGTYRDCREEDISWVVGLVDELDNLSFLMPAGFAADRDSKMAEVVSAKQCMLNTDKPLVVITETPEDLRTIHGMAEVKTPHSFSSKPFFVNYAEPISPLVNPDASAQKVIYCAEEEIPLLYSPFLAMGATAPQNAATAVAQACAESLFGLVLHQQVNPGAPFVFGGMPSMMDMQTANFSYGAPDLQVMSSAIAEMGHHFGLPVFGTAGTGDSKRFDGQAMMEALSSVYMASLSGANLIHDVGLFGSAKVLIPDMIVAIDEMIALIKHTLRGMEVGDKVDISLLKELGPGGEFVSHKHTLENFKSSWYPRFLDRSPYSNQDVEEFATFRERINDYVLGFLDGGSKKSSVDSELRDELEEIESELATTKK